MPTLLLTATLRPALESQVTVVPTRLVCALCSALTLVQVMYDLGLEDVKTFNVIRSPVDQGRQVHGCMRGGGAGNSNPFFFKVTIQWITSKEEAIAWLKQHQPCITFVMSRCAALIF